MSRNTFAGYESDNLDAVYQFFLRSSAKTPDAKKIQDEFLNWHSSVKSHTWFYISEDEVKKAFEYRDRFNRANATTPEQKKRVEEIISTGVASGHYTAPADFGEKKSGLSIVWNAFPLWQKVLIGIGAGAFVGVQGAKAVPAVRALVKTFKR